MESASLNTHYRRLGAAAFEDFRTASIVRLVLDLAGPPRGALLDIGTGPGVMPEAAWKAGWSTLGIDIAEAQVELAAALLQERGAPSSLVTCHTPASLAAAFPARRFDVITMMDVLEHVSDPVTFLRDTRSLLATTGTIFVTVPAHPEFYDARDSAIGHRERYTREALVGQLQAAGYTVHRVRYWNLLGWLHRKLRRRNASQDADRVHAIRYAESWHAPILRSALRFWFRAVENRTSPPTGLTLIAFARAGSSPEN